MKTIKQVPFELVKVELIPDQMEPGKLYFSQTYECTNHLCLCGCGVQCFLPIGPGGWALTDRDGSATLTPSILQRFECRSHYIITNGLANFV